MSLGDFIRERRITLDISKAEAARRAGVSRRTWHEVEEGTRSNVTQLTLSQIDQALQLEEGTLWAMTAHSGNRQIESLRQRSIDLIRKMTGDEMQVFLDSEGTGTIRSVLAGLQAELAALQAELRELRRERGMPGGPPGDSPGGRPELPGGRTESGDPPGGWSEPGDSAGGWSEPPRRRSTDGANGERSSLR